MVRSKRSKQHFIEVGEDVKNKVIHLSQRYGFTMKAVVSTIVDLCVDYDLLKEGWDERLNAAMDKGEIQIKRDELAKLKGKCAGMFFADEFYKCIQGREDKTPMIKKLAKDMSEALEACAGCGETKFIKRENTDLRDKIIQLETKIQEKSNQTFEAPVCNYGAILSTDGLTFSGCKVSRGKPVSVREYCMKRLNGLPCSMFVKAIIGVGKTKSEKPEDPSKNL